MDKQKADAILTDYLTKIYGFAIKRAFPYQEAEELSANIIKELYESLLKAKEIYNMEGYIWRISEHVYSKYVASIKRHQGVSLDEVSLSSVDHYDFENTDAEFLRLRREIAFLTETRRTIVYAYYYENKSIALISAERGIPSGTVKWHLNQARHELRKGFDMERNIGKLGIKPIQAVNFGHDGDPGANGGPEFYLGDRLNLNIVYSVYDTPKTKEEIAETLGITPVFIEEKINMLESNGFLVRKAGDKFTTYVNFSPETYSLEKQEQLLKKQLETAQLLSETYVQAV